MNANLIQVETEDGIVLNSLYKQGDKNRPAVIIIHGFLSDFYSHKFFHSIQERLAEAGVASICIQTRGTGLRTEFIKRNRLEGKYIGSLYERIEESHLDVSAFIEFLLMEGYEDIVLAGHSLGTIKAVRYIYEGKHNDKVKKLVLLAPFDKNGYIEGYTKGKREEYMEMARKQVSKGKGESLVPEEFDDFSMSYTTYISWYTDSDLSNMWDFYRKDSYGFPSLRNLTLQVQVIVGDKDEFFYLEDKYTFEDSQECLEKNIKNLKFERISGSGHTYVGYEDQVASLVEKFVRD
jgi:pimeloyl-ACP methyl ester carboxylesterase